MAYSKTQIFNLALGEIPAQRVTVDTENTPQARACRQFYQAVLDETLEAHDWRIARRQVALSQLPTNDRDTEWLYAYSLPSTCARPLLLVPQWAQTPTGFALRLEDILAQSPGAEPLAYDVQGTTLYTNEADAVLRYVRNDVAASDLPPLLAKAVYLELAARASGLLTSDERKKQGLLSLAYQALQTAKAGDRNAVPSKMEHTPDWISARA